MGNELIEITLEEIAKNYQTGTLPWAKANRPDEWKKMLALECSVNEMALGGNQDGLKGTLNEYQRLIVAMVREFKTLEEKKGQRTFRFK